MHPFARRRSAGVADALTLPGGIEDFRLDRHDPSAAWDDGGLVETRNGHAFVAAVGTSIYNGPEGFTVHDVREGPSANAVFLVYVNAGLRAVDVGDPLPPNELGYFVPETPWGEPAIQSNDVGMDENGLLDIIDRGGAGMHIVEYLG